MKNVGIGTSIAAVLGVVIFAFIVFGTFSPPTTESVQHGYRGTGMDLIYHRADLLTAVRDNGVVKTPPKAEPSGQKASAIYKNLKVLGDLDVSEFNRLMASMAIWVAPTQSCAYCHGNSGNFASDDLYTKKVARRMLQMTRHINADWQKHVGKTGVTCFTCHRGQPVPAYIWYENAGPLTDTLAGLSTAAGDTGLGKDPFYPYLKKAEEIRVVSTATLPGTDHQSIKQTEGTYGLMMHFSNALGVNCTFCHNTRSFMSWNQSSPQRATAWYGIRMVRDLNEKYLGSLAEVFPKNRLGPHGDVPKVNCTTCHQGAYKPLLGAQVAKDYPELLVTNDTASAKKEEAPPPAKEEPKKDEKPAAEAPKEAPKPDASKPEAPKAEPPKPDAAKPDAAKPDAAKPEAPKAEAPKAEPPKADASKPEPPKADASKPDEAKPDASNSDATEPPKANTPN